MVAAATGRPKLAYVYHPASFPTLSLAEAATRLAELIWVVDRSLPAMDNMCHLLARFGTVLDVSDCTEDEAAERLAAERPEGILTLADSRLEFTAALASRLGLAFVSPESAHALTDKHAQRAALVAGGVEVPRSRVAPPLEDEVGWAELAGAIRFPAVLKPRVGEGSKDTFKVATLAETRALVAASEREHPGRPLVLEEYLADATDRPVDGFGGYVSVECIASRGRVQPVAVTGRFPPAEPFRETGFFIPAALAPDEHAAVIDLAVRAAEALGVHIGCLHTEIKFTPDGPRVIEVNGRLGGGIPEMLADAAGVNLYDVAFRLALGEDVVFSELCPCDAIGWLLYVHAPDWMSRVVAVNGLEELAHHAMVRDVQLNRRPGEHVDWREGNHGHVFSVRGVARDHEHLRALERQVHEDVLIKGD